MVNWYIFFYQVTLEFYVSIYHDLSIPIPRVSNHRRFELSRVNCLWARGHEDTTYKTRDMFVTSDSSFLEHQSLYILKKIGQGSFSNVYLARFRDVVNDRETLIATKVINKNRVSAGFVHKFLHRELDVMVKLKHPFIVQLYSVFQNGSKIYLNMEYAMNGNLFSYLQKSKKLTEDQIRVWLMQILWAFSYMHGVGVVHRDLKCENILLTKSYNVRIADFGFSRFVDRRRNSGADTICGTLIYSAPELLEGERSYNPMAVDVWAIGVVLFMMANNTIPFYSSHDVMRNLRKKQMQKDFIFRRSMFRSKSLKELISTFLEPNVLRRTKIQTALQHPWIKEGNIEMPADVVIANESITESISYPKITRYSLKLDGFHYLVTEYGRPISTFNQLFKKVVKDKGPKTKKIKNDLAHM